MPDVSAVSEFLQHVKEAFRSLLSRDLLTVESSDYDALAFGNAVVTLVGQNLRLRMIRDRGETLAEAASRLEPDDWFPLQRVIRAIGAADAPSEGLLTPEEAAQITERFLTDLEHGLESGQFRRTKSRLAELDKLALKRLVDRVNGKQ